ncbi:MAG: 30S ribosomal protein S8 [Parcubacteria group bacterium]
MPLTDPIADMLTRIRNGYLAKKDEIALPHSQLKQALAAVLAKSGFIASTTKAEQKGGNVLIIKLRYGPEPERFAALRGVKRVSKPGQRIYVSKRRIPRVQQGLGMAVLSTPQGLLTDGQARKRGLGGEVICTLW